MTSHGISLPGYQTHRNGLSRRSTGGLLPCEFLFGLFYGGHVFRRHGLVIQWGAEKRTDDGGRTCP